MLVIRRRAGQSVIIGGGIEIEVIEAGSGRVKLGIRAPRDVVVLRKEIAETREENVAAARGLNREAVGRLIGRLRPAAGG
jgi:carbon storage regulator